MKILFWHILLLVLSCQLMQAQNIYVDSLQRDVNEYQYEDSMHVNKLLALAIAIPNNQKEIAEAIYLQAEKLSSKIGWKKGEANTLRLISRFYGNQKQFDKSITAGLKAIKLAAELNDSSLRSLIYLEMGHTYRYMDDFKQAEVYTLKAMEIGRTSNHQYVILDAYQLLAGIYSDKKEWDIFHLYADSLMKLANLLNSDVATGNILFLLGEEQAEKKNYAKAIEYYLQYLQVMKREKNQIWISFMYTRLSITYSSMNMADSAFYYAKQALDLSSLNKFDLDVAYQAYYFAYDADHDYKNALKYYLLYDSCVHQSYNMEAGQHVANVSAKSEQEKKDAVADAAIKRQQLIRNGSLLVSGIIALFALVFLRQRNKTKNEKKKSDALLLNILPFEVATELKTSGYSKAKAFTMVTVMFTDFKDFTTVSEKISAELLVDEIHHCFSAFDNILQKYKIEKIKTIGDAYLCASGLPISNYTHATDMLRAAFEFRDFMLKRKKEKENKGEIPFEMRIGIHTGPVVAGIVGIKKYAYDIWGDTVNIAARMEQNSEAGKINISGSTYELVKEKFKCEHRGKIQAKNKGEIDMYFAEAV